MPQNIKKHPTCSVCNHEKIDEINEMLMEPSITISQVCRKFKIKSRSAETHRKNHMPLSDLHTSKYQMSLCFWMRDQLTESIRKMMEKGSYKNVSGAAKAMMQLLEHLDNYSEKLYIENTVQIIKSSQWKPIQEKINKVLEKYPDAKRDVAIALSELIQ